MKQNTIQINVEITLRKEIQNEKKNTRTKWSKTFENYQHNSAHVITVVSIKRLIYSLNRKNKKLRFRKYS